MEVGEIRNDNGDGTYKVQRYNPRLGYWELIGTHIPENELYWSDEELPPKKKETIKPSTVIYVGLFMLLLILILYLWNLTN